LSVLASLRNTDPKKDDENILTFQKEGYLIFVGRNAFSNEKLIADHNHKECLWMHAMAARGSHIILCLNNNPDPSEGVIQYAAEIALKNSHSQARTVCVALLKDVYKPDGGGVGVWKTSRRTTVEVL
jgi:predicted ribosome quality control (RQC) complex YloA/Tae2 family protein